MIKYLIFHIPYLKFFAIQFFIPIINFNYINYFPLIHLYTLQILTFSTPTHLLPPPPNFKIHFHQLEIIPHQYSHPFLQDHLYYTFYLLQAMLQQRAYQISLYAQPIGHLLLVLYQINF